MQLEVLIGPDLYADLQARKAAPEPESHAPTDAELRARCKALGFAVPAPRRNHAKSLDAVRAEARDHMLALLRGGDR